jgi:hypothetical protein
MSEQRGATTKQHRRAGDRDVWGKGENEQPRYRTIPRWIRAVRLPTVQIPHAATLDLENVRDRMAWQ